jgi:hypothetical protein
MPSSISRALCLGFLAAVVGCHASPSNQNHGPGSDMAGTGGDDMATPTPPGSGDMATTQSILDVEPTALQTLVVTSGQPIPTAMYTATYGGNQVNVGWAIDRGDVGGITAGPAAQTTFTPKGAVAGMVTLTAGFKNITVKRQIMVQVVATQNGVDPNNPSQSGQIAPTDPTQLNSGGGVGGVGGEGLGGAVTDPGTVAALGNPTSNGSTQNLAFLYPYDKTVFPRGILAPLLMWSWTPNDADAIQISVKTSSGSYSYTGQFGRPAILATTGGPYVRSPIPQDVWQNATNSAGATDKVTVSLTVAKGGVGYGPISETWTIAPAHLSGIIYYNSYGTRLALNSTDQALGGDHKFGGAVLSIHVGDTGPKLAAGGNSTGNQTGCRVCHSVSADGSRLVVQHGDSYGTSSAYDLSPTGTTEHVLSIGTTFPGMYPDGSMALSSNDQLLPLPNDGTPITTTGLNNTCTNLGTPAFSPDKSLIAFNPMAGPGVTNPTKKLEVMSYSPSSNAFSSAVTVVDDTAAATGVRSGWPAFLPDNKSLVFHHQSVAGSDGDSATNGQLYTRKGAKAQIAWTSVSDSTHVTALDQLNGKGYLPKLAASTGVTCNADGTAVGGINPLHDDDVDLNYEPTVAPVAAGGYVWVVFTSRRMYGNEATIPPFCSDPRGVDLVKNLTTKKLWVAAIDLNAQPGSDASHPAFYLPAQELLAGNSRGFWVLDPCRMDGTSCDTGDQCCNGYCEPNSSGMNVCSNAPPNASCSQVSEKCTTAADCCDKSNLCINGFCADSPIS